MAGLFAVGVIRPRVGHSARGAHRARRSPAGVGLARLPLTFVPNVGQLNSRARYVSQAGDASVFLTRRALTLAFSGNRGRGVALEVRFLGASHGARLEAGPAAAGTFNYLVGKRSHWRTGLHGYRTVAYRGLWPGIDLVLGGHGGRLKYEFHVAPGADPGAIRLAYRGATGVALGPGGDLSIQTALGSLSDSPPLSYQLVDGRRVSVRSRYALEGGGRYRFSLGSGYDPHRPLVIDPTLVYSTFLGGSSSDQAAGIALDQAGDAYVTGRTTSMDFPTTPGAFDRTYQSGPNLPYDIFVTKLDPSGSALVYSTLIGGSDFDEPTDIRVDQAGDAFVTGQTMSTDFPTTAGAFDTTYNDTATSGVRGDAFVTKLNPDGSGLVYSTYVGGTARDVGNAIAIDGDGNAYLAGSTASTDLPTTAGAVGTSFNGPPDLTELDDAFVAKLNSSGSALDYCTYLGGTGRDEAGGIAVGSDGSAYVTGDTGSSDFPFTPLAFDRKLHGSVDAYVTKLNPSGSALAYSTFLGGPNRDFGVDIATDDSGHAYVTGYTQSLLFPTTAGAFDRTHNGRIFHLDRGGQLIFSPSNDVFVTKLNPGGATLAYSTFLGGAMDDSPARIALDGAGDAYVAGTTFSQDFPVTPGAPDSTLGPPPDADGFVTKLDAAGSSLFYSTFLGGSPNGDGMSGIAIDSSGAAYVAGGSASSDYPTTPGAFATSLDGPEDAVVTKIGADG